MSGSCLSMEKAHYICPICKSIDIVADASARWDSSLQEFVLTDVMDRMSCENCGHESNHEFECKEVDLALLS